MTSLKFCAILLYSTGFVSTVTMVTSVCLLLVQSSETVCSIHGSTVQGTSCFIASRFYTTWAEAYSFCSMIGCNLAAPENDTKITSIQQYANSVGLITNLYLGGTDASSEGTFVHAGTGRPIDALAWALGEPSGDTQENCLMTDNVYDFLISDTNCNDKRRFICDCPSS